MKEHVPDPNELLPLTQKALEDIVVRHDMYLRGQHGGARAVLQYRNLSHLDFSGKNFSQADFTGSLFLETNFEKSNLTGSSFFACDMRNSNLRYANCKRTDLRGAYIAGADLTGADLTGADMREGKIMKRGERGVLTDRKRSGGEGAKTVFTGA